MHELIRISCPGADKTRKERIEGLFDSCFEWLYSDALKKLISLFDGEELADSIGNDRERDLIALHDFASRWDFRKGKERWAVEDAQFVTDNADFIMEQAAILGLVDIVTPQIEPDFILPLGGARLSNLVRPKMCRKVIDENGYSNKLIVALSGTRPINEVERPYTDQYSPDAVTEYDAICSGLELSFGISEFTEERHDDVNINNCSSVRKYTEKYNSSSIYSLAAPSSDPAKRRANSFDTFEYLLEKFDVGEGSKLLLVTSCIYVPFQYLKFMRLAINGGFEVDCIGSDVVDAGKMSKPSNYLQETKGTIDAIYGLWKELND